MATTETSLNWDYDGPIMEVEGLEKHFPQDTGIVSQLIGGETSYVKAVDGVDMAIGSGETMGLVGESGCGKSTLGEVLIGLQEQTGGSIKFLGTELSSMSAEQRKEFRRNVQMIFQDPYESLNPRFSVEQWIREPLEVHDIDNQDERIYEALERAELTPPENYIGEHPHELSGGERQRVSIARALVLEPKFIVADEPVSMLDVSIRAGVLNLFRQLAEERDVTILYISHDLATVRHICTEIAVMYLGKVMEYGPTERICSEPSHPYTERLLSATPVADPTHDRSKVVYDQEVPDPVDLPEGCFFKHRCEFATEACDDEDMHLRPPAKAETDDEEWLMACHRAADADLDWETIASHNL